MYYYEQLLRHTIDNSGLSLRDVGREIGVPATTLNDWLISGNRPHLKNLVRISEWSGHSVPALLADTDSDNLDERIILLLQTLTTEQKQEVLEQIAAIIT